MNVMVFSYNIDIDFDDIYLYIDNSTLIGEL